MSKLYVLCKIAGGEYAIPATEVFQLENFHAPTPVPGSPAYVMGVLQVRQRLVPVIDARRRLGLPAAAPDAGTRLVVLQLGARLVGLVVDGAREVQTLDANIFIPILERGPRETGGFIRGAAQNGGRIIFLLDTKEITGEDTHHG